MKVLLTTLNAKYIHSSLALRYLQKYCQQYNYDIRVKEFSINENIEDITGIMYKTGSDIFAFSCYIWNINKILEIADRLKKVKPECNIILGGPEVSYDSKKLLKKYQFIDYIIKGEGEKPLQMLLENLINTKGELTTIPGLVFKDNQGIIIENDFQIQTNLGKLPFPYKTSDLDKLSHKIVYYETSRGCPFNCSYCLSSTTANIRYFPLERVKEELLFFIDNEVELVKLVDRTFNANPERARKIFEFIVENQKQTCFHFEIAADLFDDDLIKYLQKIPEGWFRFEIGVQSTNSKTINTIDRKMDWDQLAHNVKKLREKDNINLHLDLIAGLPQEDYNSFKKSFNDVYQLAPHEIQLGFLKLLKGSKIRNEADDFNYKYTEIPPYEVLENNSLSYREILKFKGVEFIVKKYYNSGVFTKSLYYILNNIYHSPYQLFEDMYQYFEENNLHRKSHSRKTLYDIFYNFYENRIKQSLGIFSEYLKFDLLLNNYGVKLQD